ncbi:MAG: hypothetical protein P8X67_10260 [Syntrophobacterales bacterium]|jgi:hypothetical protein
MGSRRNQILVATLVFPAEFPSSYLHFTTPRPPGMEAVQLGIGTNGLASFLGGKDPER